MVSPFRGFRDTVAGSEILHQVIWRSSHYLQGFIHPGLWSPDFWTINGMDDFQKKSGKTIPQQTPKYLMDVFVEYLRFVLFLLIQQYLHKVSTLPETNSSPLKMMVSNRNLLFQRSIFRGYVSFRGVSHHFVGCLGGAPPRWKGESYQGASQRGGGWIPIRRQEILLPQRFYDRESCDVPCTQT